MRRFAIVSFLLFVPLALACGSATTQGAAEKSAAPAAAAPDLLDGLGDHQRPITTSSPEAQRYFDQGLALIYGFNHDAAIRSFDWALTQDPACAMCAWGKATALGPNINLPLGPAAAEDAYEAAQLALRLSKNATPVEQELIAAVAARYTPTYSADRAALDLKYANAMREVRKHFPEDVDVAVLTAEALMNLYPWSYWTRDAEPKEHTAELVALLEWAMAREPNHVGPTTWARTTTTSTPWRSTSPRRRRPRPTGSRRSRPTRATSSTCPATSTTGSAATPTRRP
jgi:hypothetical protein